MAELDIPQIAKPIMFNTEMVQAILEGRKTATRRVIKFSPNKFTGEIPKADEITVYKKTLYHESVSFHIEPFYCMDVKKPYERLDYLYVRETWRVTSVGGSNGVCWYECQHKADMSVMTILTIDYDKYSDFVKKYYDGRQGWIPSIFMPKRAARIFLRVTDVRAERLQEIEKDGLIKEGIDPFDDNFGELEYATAEFAALWDSTIKPKDRDKYGWDANPWVWVIEFEPVQI